jgi:hypothetical protein
MEIARSGVDTPGRLLARLLDAHPITTIHNLLRSQVDPPFVRVYTEINFRDGGRSAGTSAPSRPTDSPAFHDPSAL